MQPKEAEVAHAPGQSLQLHHQPLAPLPSAPGTWESALSVCDQMGRVGQLLGSCALVEQGLGALGDLMGAGWGLVVGACRGMGPDADWPPVARGACQGLGRWALSVGARSPHLHLDAPLDSVQCWSMMHCQCRSAALLVPHTTSGGMVTPLAPLCDSTAR
jgi:hypothetical protein